MEGLPPGIDLWQIPYQPPPPGVKPDFNKRFELLNFTAATVAVMIFLQVFFLGLRIYTRLSRRDERWKIDDWCVLVTVILCSTLGAVLIVGVQPMGRHGWDVSLGFLMTAWAQRVVVMQHVFVGMSLYLGKCCLLTMYWRVFGHIDRVRWQIIITAVFAFPLLFSSIFQPIVNSPPPGKPWGTPNPHNILGTRTTLAAGIDSLIVDLIILYIPIPIVTRMNISRRRRFGVLMIFLTGSIAIVADIVLLYYRVELFKQIDVLRYGFIVGTCTVIEIAVSVICSSMPVAAKFCRITIGHFSLYNSLRSRFSSRGGDSGNGPSFGLPSFIRKPKPAKRRDPYSINMPSTNLSETHITKPEGTLDLAEVPHGYVRSEPEIRPANRQVRLNNGEIQRTVSVERESFAYTESEKSKTGRDMV